MAGSQPSLFAEPSAGTKRLLLACLLRSRTHKARFPVEAARPLAPDHGVDAHSPVRLWPCSHASGHVSDRSAPISSYIARWPVGRACMRARLRKHPWGHSCPVCAQPRSTYPLPLRSDTPLADMSSWAGAVVFGLLWLGLDWSRLDYPAVIEDRRGGVFGYS
jgi:hypothetical protein